VARAVLITAQVLSILRLNVLLKKLNFTRALGVLVPRHLLRHIGALNKKNFSVQAVFHVCKFTTTEMKYLSSISAVDDSKFYSHRHNARFAIITSQYIALNVSTQQCLVWCEYKFRTTES